MSETPAGGKRPGAGTAFPRAERMRTDREYREVVRRGARIATPHFTIYRDGRGGADRKIGVSAGRKVGGAVVRNRIKRLVREFYRHHKGLFPPGTRTAVVVKALPEGATLATVGSELLPALTGRWGGKGPDGPKECADSSSR